MCFNKERSSFKNENSKGTKTTDKGKWTEENRGIEGKKIDKWKVNVGYWNCINCVILKKQNIDQVFESIDKNITNN